ncbi:unnamed protein product [Alopecurus aequalis]
MLRLQNHLRFALRAASHLPASSLHPFLPSSAVAVATSASSLHPFLPSSAVAVATSASHAQFMAADYLVATFGLAPPQALLKASKYLSHLKSPANPDAVRAFLSQAGLAESDIAAAVAMDPRLLCSSVDKTLTPRIAQLRGIGLSLPEISRLITVVPAILLRPARFPRLEFMISLLGSYHKVEPVLKRNRYLLNGNVENLVKVNTILRQQCGLSACEIAKLYGRTGKLLTMEPDRVKGMVARAEKLFGVPRCSGMFKRALEIVCIFTPESITGKINFLERHLGRSEAEQAVRNSPGILALSAGNLGHTLEFLMMEVGLDPSYIARRSGMLTFSIEKRLMPRHYVIVVLKAKELVKKDIDLYGQIPQVQL